MEKSDYLFDYKKLQYMTYDERIQEFQEYANDRDMSVLLEYFYASYWKVFDKVSYENYDYMFNLFTSELENYYKYLIYSQSGNKTTEKAYSFTNENLKNFFNSEYIDVNGKRVLTVGSSGDQALNAIYYGAKSVDVVDMNIMTKLFIDLKTAMIKNLSFEDFEQYSVAFVDYIEKYYPKISHDLPPETQRFFDTILLNGDFVWLNNFIRESGFRGASNSVIYTDIDAYNSLQNKLLSGDYEINVIVGDIARFVDLTHGKYDLILLSNIYEYFAMHASTDAGGRFVEEFYEAIENLYKNRLDKNGLIEVTSRDYRITKMYSDETKHLHKFLKTLGGEIISIPGGGMNDGMYFDYPAILIAKTQQTRTLD